MSERWRVARPHGGSRLVDIREGGPEGGSRFVCEATPEDADLIVGAVNAARAEGDDRGLAQEVERLRAALEDIKLRYDEEGKFAARDMWRVAYEALDASNAALRGGSAAPAREG